MVSIALAIFKLSKMSNKETYGMIGAHFERGDHVEDEDEHEGRRGQVVVEDFGLEIAAGGVRVRPVPAVLRHEVEIATISKKEKCNAYKPQNFSQLIQLAAYW